MNVIRTEPQFIQLTSTTNEPVLLDLFNIAFCYRYGPGQRRTMIKFHSGGDTQVTEDVATIVNIIKQVAIVAGAAP